MFLGNWLGLGLDTETFTPEQLGCASELLVPIDFEKRRNEAYLSVPTGITHKELQLSRPGGY